MKLKTKNILIAVAIVILVGLTLWFVQHKKEVQQNQIKEASALFTVWLSEQKDITDYKITKIDYTVDKSYPKDTYGRDLLYSTDSNSVFIADVFYDDKPAENNTAAIAGNGEMRSDGWVVCRELFVKIDNNKMEVLGTGL